MTTISLLLLPALMLIGSTLLAEDRLLFEFKAPAAARDWQTAND